MKDDCPTLLETDVLIVGGGPAGMCAAIASARGGARTAIVERWPILGGQATMAHVNMWHTSDCTKEVILGLTKELEQRLRKHDGIQTLPSFPNAHETYAFNPDILTLVYEELVQEEKIRTLCSTPCVDVVMDGRSITGVVVGTKIGLRTIKASVYVDSSGDGDVGFFAGCETQVGRESDGKCQGMTLVTRFDGLDMDRIDEIEAYQDDGIAEMSRLRDKGQLPPSGPHWFGGNRIWRWPGSLIACTNGDPLDAEDLTRAEMAARASLPKFIKFFRENWPGCENLEIGRTGSWLGIRESRRIRGHYTFDAKDVAERNSFTDAIGHGFWMVDIHDPNGTGHTTWYDRSTHLEKGTTYQIPYRILVARDVENLLIAGRCASATHEGMAGLRVQSHCHIMGQAAGTAAAMCLGGSVSPADVDVNVLQDKLVEDGVMIDIERARG